MFFAELTIQYQDKSEIIVMINLDSVNELIITKQELEKLNVNPNFITNIDIRIKCRDFFYVAIENKEVNSKHYGIKSHANYRSSIAILKLYNIDLIHINDLDINHIETENSSPLIVQCNINELYTGCEVHRCICNNEAINLLKYKVDIRRDTKINHFSGNGEFDVNIQESTLKELSVMGFINNGQNLTFINRLSIWNGSKVTNLKLSAMTAHFEIKDSSVEYLTIGKSHIKEIKLQNEVIGKCSIIDESIDSDDIAKWILEKKSALQNGNRIHYLNASYMINKKYTEFEKHWSRKWLLKIFSLICGYGYKPLRTIAFSIFIIALWAGLYWVIGFLSPGSFYKSNNTNVLSFIDYIYYSGITYTTTGYGDIVPVNQIIKILSIIEAITGVSMLSLFIFSLTKSLTEHTQI